MISVLGLLVVLGVLVFIHEAGHFAAAKWAGIWVHRFSLGLGTPIKAFSFTRGGTEYCISWLPLGGYVKMASREEEATTSALEGGAVTSPVPPGGYYEDKPVWKRMVVTLAGVAMNALFAWSAFIFLAVKNGEQVIPETRIGRVSVAALPSGATALGRLTPGERITAVDGRPIHSWSDVVARLLSAEGKSVSITVNDSLSVVVRIPPEALATRDSAAQALAPWMPAVVELVQPSSPAARAGMERGDTIVAVEGKAIVQWYDLVDVLKASPGRELSVDVARAGGRTTLHVTPDVFDTAGTKIGKIGISQHIQVISKRYTIQEAIHAGTVATGAAALTIVQMIRGLITRRVSTRELGGPIMIAQVAGASLRLGLDYFLSTLGLISINLALVNLLPIPVLDGGQLVFLIYEGGLRRPVPVRLREWLMMFGILFVLALMILVTWNDLRRIFGW